MGIVWMGQSLSLRCWDPAVGCLDEGPSGANTWVKLIGIPLHFCTEGILQEIGKIMGGLTALDRNTSERSYFEWARIQVKNPAYKIPSVVEIISDETVWVIPVWIENPVVVPTSVFEGENSALAPVTSIAGWKNLGSSELGSLTNGYGLGLPIQWL
ncbi:hypothetical protein A4A49_37404 [Nicotiana attenuata]|uniref:Uncharacterized protein n=1 Tax=Nicotiana attenuata TaxID=49451 RepID=A0A1J6KTT1_NICAT|nr:hypothetical protein A4A49_37404 [Nicotiana attenuata]